MADFDPTIPLPGTDLKLFARFMAKVRVTDACWLWTASVSRDGYGKFGHGGRAHRVAYEMFIGDIEPGLMVCHSCDTPACVRPSHLWVGTNRENQLDARRKGRLATGDRNGSRATPEALPRGDDWHKRHDGSVLFGDATPSAKLCATDVSRIRELFREGIGVAKIAETYSVTKQNIWCIVRRKTWRHLG